MTFLEAAIAILQREGRPLHFKQLTEIALKENLLTVVGRTPEVTMQQRLNDALKKSDPSLILTREKPGVFGLRYYASRPSTAPADSGEGEDTATRAAPPSAAATRNGEAAGTPPTEERKRRRRRGGRGRRRPDEAGAAANGEEATASGQMELPEPSESIDEEPAAAASPDRVSEEAPESIAESEPAPAVSAERAPEPRPPSAPPERRSFAEAAAEVAAAHRQRAAHAGRPSRPPPEPGESEPSSEAAEVTQEMEAVEVAPELAPSAAEVVEEFVAAPPSIEEREAPSSPPVEERREAFAEAPPPVEAAAAEELAFSEEELLDEEDINQPSGPLIAPAFGTEELVRGEDHRPLVEEGPRGRRHRRERNRGGGRPEARPGHGGSEGQRDQRDQRDRQRGGGRPADRRPAPAAAAHQDRPRQPPPAPPPPPPSAPPAPVAARPVEARPPVVSGGDVVSSTMDAVVEVLRACEGRAVHARQIVEMGLKRRLLRGDAGELVRVVRGAVIAELRERESSGLRARVRAVGGSSYALADRRLEAELTQQERELANRAKRLTDATRLAFAKRLARMGVPEFESLMRLLLARLGLVGVELVKRGEGVGYFGGDRVERNRRRRVLVALRPGEGALGRRAIGELRAGLKARGFEEGLLLAAGSAAPDAYAELATGGQSVEMFDGEMLAALCAEEGVGVVKRQVVVDTLDIDLLAELAEG